ncbi:MAG: aminotransferase class V-fold PLP-dependent enzyme [Rhodothermales bacterium]
MHRRRFLNRLATTSVLPLAAPGLPHLKDDPQYSGDERRLSSDDRLARLREDLATATDDASYWRRVRQEFQLQPGLIHLNCGSLGATPRLVTDAVAAWAAEIEGNPPGKVFAWGDAEMDPVREKAAAFLGAEAGEIAITRNTTEGMNAVATGLDLRPGDQLLTTNHEHGGGMTCWQYLRKHRGVEIVYVELPERVNSKADILNRITDKITPRTRACSFSHIDTITGTVMPIPEIAELVHARDILFVCDGAQAPGMVPVDLHALGVDAYACSGHKWMLAPKGTGLLYVRKESQDRIHPPFLYSGYAGYTASGGTRGVDRVLGQGLAIDFFNVIGRERIATRCRQLTAQLRAHLDGMDGIRQLTPDDSDLNAALFTYALERGTSGEIRKRMDVDYNIQIKSTQGTYAYCEEPGLNATNYNAVRFSTHIYNDEQDIDRAMEAFRAAI